MRRTFLGISAAALLLAIQPVAVSATLQASASSSGLIRVAGDNRFSTSAQVSVFAFPSGQAPAAVLANGRNYPDALAGVPLASLAAGPLLLSEQASIPPEVLAELQRVLIPSGKVYVLGGLSAISQAVQDQLGSLGYVVERLAGGTRYETARAIADKLTELRGVPSQAAYVVSGTSFADALSVSPLAAIRRAPIVLTQPTTLTPAARDILANPGTVAATVIGGTAAVSSGVQQAITNLGKTTDRIAGSSRYDTSRKVADAVRGVAPSGDKAGVASGESFPDALSAGVHQALLSSPLLLVKRDNDACLASSKFLLDNTDALTAVYLYGGTAAVSSAAETTLNTLLAGTDACHPPKAPSSGGGGTSLPSYSLSGTGQQAAGPISLSAGISIFSLSHSGTSNFIVELLDNKGNNIDLLANEIGNFGGSTATHLDKSGNYTMNVEADGPWTIDVSQPRPTSAPSTKSFSGAGPTATEAFYMGTALKTFHMTHDGSSNFIVTLLDKNGNWVELLANEIGTFSGSKAVGITTAGIYYIDIEADGDWTVSY